MLKKILCLILIAASFSAFSLSSRGENVYKAYCSGCHTLKYYLSDTNMAEIALRPSDALHWFGRQPPDLSLIVRQKGRDGLRQYLNGFYLDRHQLFGENNRFLMGTRMPNPFSMTSVTEKEQLIEELVSFLDFVSDPSAATRYRIGWMIALFFVVLFLLLRRIWN